MQRTLHLLGSAAWNALPLAIVITDTSRIVHFINTAACQLLEVKPEAMLGQPFATLPGGNSFMTREETIAFYQRINEVALPGHALALPPPDELTWSVLVQDRHLEFRTTAIYDEHQEQLGVVIQIEERTSEWNAQGLLSIMLSESLVPLSSIQGFADVLLLDGADPLSERQRECVTYISSRAAQFLAVRQHVLDTARKQAQGKVPT
jgi:signal transduction histidine kinase